jgi:DNA-binding response OmpR family regulator
MANTTDRNLPTIVYVEDNAGDAILLEDALRERGYATELVVIERGDKALHYFEMKATARDIPPPHCILLDAHLPIVTGAQLLRFIRTNKPYDDTPVYIFAAESEYKAIITSELVSKESFITKATNWDEMLALADLLMESAKAKQDNTAASTEDSKPEVHAEGALRRQETVEQRARTESGPPAP